MGEGSETCKRSGFRKSDQVAKVLTLKSFGGRGLHVRHDKDRHFGPVEVHPVWRNRVTRFYRLQHLLRFKFVEISRGSQRLGPVSPSQ